MFFYLLHFPSSRKISDQSDKMPRNETKNKTAMYNEKHFLCKFNIQPTSDTLEFGRQNSICLNCKDQISKCPDLSQILPPVLVHIMPYRPSTKQILYTPCTVQVDMVCCFF